jgi:hypothetical protein
MMEIMNLTNHFVNKINSSNSSNHNLLADALPLPLLHLLLV